MNIIIAAIITTLVALEFEFNSMLFFFALLTAGAVFPLLHNALIKESKDAHMGISYLIVVLAATIGIMRHDIFWAVMQISLLFLAGTLFFVGFKQANAARG